MGIICTASELSIIALLLIASGVAVTVLIIVFLVALTKTAHDSDKDLREICEKSLK